MPKPDRGSTLFTAAPLPVAPLDDRGRLACLRLIRSENVGPVAFRELINHYGGAEQALDALPDLARRGGSKRTIKIFPRDQAEAELEAAHSAGSRPVFTIEPGYPAALATVEAPPPLLYVKGDMALFARTCVAIVGSRQCSAAGTKVARQFAKQLGQHGYVIASGLARGIDGAAHQAALETGTVGVLAGGIDITYPPEHAALHAMIAARGCLVTEQPPGVTPRGQDFPRRNRIISGLSLGVVVVEAARRSGSLITARFAAEQGREVFAIPGHPLDPRAEGTNQLLKDGATLVTTPDDVIEMLTPMAGFSASVPRRMVFEPDDVITPAGAASFTDTDRNHVLSVLGPAPIDIDEVVRATKLSIRTVQITIMELDLAGRIERHGGQLVSLRA